LKKRDFHQFDSIQKSHKEKEMADFRKWLLAFAAVALILSMSTSANAQVVPALQCVANAGVPPIVRAEGLTELVGDLVLNCTGGTPTAVGGVVPQSNVQIFLNTNVTSKLLASPFSEALLMIDEPHSPSNTATPLLACGATGTVETLTGNGICNVIGTGTGIGTYSGATAAVGNGGIGRPNVWQGRQNGANSIVWLGVPIDPPGTTTTRVVRITNIRANANQLGVSSTLVPTQIVEYVAVNGSQALPINNPQQTVAFIQPGLIFSVQAGTLTPNINFLQCISANSAIAGNNTKALGGGAQDGKQFVARFDEGFASSWKVRNIYNSAVTAAGYNGPAGFATNAPTTLLNQNVPGSIYNTETAFYNDGADPSPNPPGYAGTVLTTTGDTTWSLARLDGNGGAGAASQGTRLMVTFSNVPTSVQIFVPTLVNVVNPNISNTKTGTAALTTTDSNGNGGYSLVSATDTTDGVAPVSIVNGSGVAVYEILYSDPFTVERVNIPVAVSYIANSGNNLPPTGVQSTVLGSFAPISTVTTADSSAPIPRFVPSGSAKNSFIVNKCQCNILFPFVTNQAGFDTGVAIANTSLDPYGTTPQTGTITLNYYGGTTGGGAAPAAQTTNAPLPAGQELIFTLSNGGNLGIAATPGFQGYIIAVTNFQYCHAFAFISDLGAQRVAEGYLGIILDVPGLNRTGQLGEVQAH
jgi:hypothetical protein